MDSASAAASAEPVEEADMVPPILGFKPMQKEKSVLKKSGDKYKQKSLKVGFSIEEPELTAIDATKQIENKAVLLR